MHEIQGLSCSNGMGGGQKKPASFQHLLDAHGKITAVHIGHENICQKQMSLILISGGSSNGFSTLDAFCRLGIFGI